MSDPYMEKLEAQRAKWVHEMPRCPQCLANPDSRTPIIDHLYIHSKPEASAPTSDASIEYSHDAPSAHYPYKSRGMTDAAAMSPKKWKKAGSK